MKFPRYLLIRCCKQSFKRKKALARNEITPFECHRPQTFPSGRLLVHKKNTSRPLQIMKSFLFQFPKIHEAAIKKTTTDKFGSKDLITGKPAVSCLEDCVKFIFFPLK